MIMAYLITLLFIIVILVQGPGFIKKKQFRELIVYLALMSIALFYSINGVTDLHFPGPAVLSEIIFKPVSYLVFPDQQK
jgi:hypothetical protein